MLTVSPDRSFCDSARFAVIASARGIRGEPLEVVVVQVDDEREARGVAVQVARARGGEVVIENWGRWPGRRVVVARYGAL